MLIKYPSTNIPPTYKTIKSKPTQLVTQEVKIELSKRKSQAIKDISRKKEYDRRHDEEEEIDLKKFDKEDFELKKRWMKSKTPTLDEIVRVII